jgi:hypothetical protein
MEDFRHDDLRISWDGTANQIRFEHVNLIQLDKPAGSRVSHVCRDLQARYRTCYECSKAELFVKIL